MADEKAERILVAAQAVFLRYGFKRTTMGDIAEAAGISRPALYLVFPLKEKIFATVLTRMLDETVQQLGPAVVVGMPNPVMVDGCYVVRVFGDPGFIKFAITNQGYGEVVRELDELV